MPLILETVVITRNPDGGHHLVPFGLHAEGDHLIVAPFRPSPTITNLEAHRFLSAAAPADVRVIAGCVTGRRDWPVVPCQAIPGLRLADAFAHAELEVVDREEDEIRPRFRCRVVHQAMHRPFIGYNRAQGAVIEAAILSTRLHMLPPEKIRAEMAYLEIAISKTAGPREREAWDWIGAKIGAALGPAPAPAEQSQG
ncbi:DUF447 domain-containing protein [Salinarimonas soli]|uniref:DUF447 family protein n=1 Tax=Salinarimonas soli TaxID=1638099 RepID=A0A5B2VGN6_9HYPH|nr:DUF447 domain-containing protein [Salinarimonas soli]KAA2237509.1 DUF447 family protein [Salinarimonas soli]